MSLEQYLGLFIDESKENLQVLNENLLKLEKEPENTEIMNEIFRVAHTFKGMAKTMGFNRISDLTHNMENLLEPLRSGAKKPNGKIVDILFSCLDKLENLVDSVIDKGTESEEIIVADLVKELQSAINSGEGGTKTSSASVASNATSLPKLELNEYEQVLVQEAVAKNLSSWEITVYIANECVLPGVRSYMVNSVLEEMGEILKYYPTVEEIEAGNFLKTGEYTNAFKVLLVTSENSNHVKDKILDISEIGSVEISDVAVNKDSSENKEVSKEMTIESKAEQVAELVESVEDLQTKKAMSKLANQTIRVSASRLDKLMNLVGELVINKTRVFELSAGLENQDLINAAGFMENITTEIQEIVMKLRMVPIDQVFNRFPRLVRDISKNLNKDVNLIIHGKEIEIDRAVVDEIGDPLVHLIRNSLDHGLETPEERISKGKPAKGTIELAALNEGDNILIKITDDGRGIDADKVKKKAIAKGLITEEIAKSMSETEIYELVFKPGFSTVDVATDLSGRGVGMDVVKSKVNSLNGIVQISSKLNEGTTVTITLPSTMAIIQALMIKLDQEIYALPLSYINEVIDVSASEVKRIRNKEVLTVRGKTIPLLRLNELLEVPGNEVNEDNLLTVVIVKCQDKYSGLCVSELIGQQEVVIKPINKNLCSAQYISGATTLGDGEVALILNINNLI